MSSLKEIQSRILEIMIYIDSLCRKNGITYFIMGGTALGAVRHAGFIPWDDDLDIFMTPGEYEKFKKAFKKENPDKFVIQEWSAVEGYLEYAKVRMNGTTFIEQNLKDRKDIHHGIFVDIMILHKVPLNKLIQKKIYLQSKFVTLYGLSQRNWAPKTNSQRVLLKMLKFLPCQAVGRWCYKSIYKYEDMQKGYKWCYYITRASFEGGLFDRDCFDKASEINFEGYSLMCPARIKDYLALRYGDYMKLPSEEEQKEAVHAMLFDADKDFKEYIKGEC